MFGCRCGYGCGCRCRCGYGCGYGCGYNVEIVASYSTAYIDTNVMGYCVLRIAYTGYYTHDGVCGILDSLSWQYLFIVVYTVEYHEIVIFELNMSSQCRWRVDYNGAIDSPSTLYPIYHDTITRHAVWYDEHAPTAYTQTGNTVKATEMFERGASACRPRHNNNNNYYNNKCIHSWIYTTTTESESEWMQSMVLLQWHIQYVLYRLYVLSYYTQYNKSLHNEWVEWSGMEWKCVCDRL
jgi:hypothetical protein